MKASGSVASLMQGVSQQIPPERQPGQHTEQVNMIPDPVHGLARRHGSRWVAERTLVQPASEFDAIVEDTANWRTFEYSNAGHDYVVLYRAKARPVGSTLPALLVYDRTDAVFLTPSRNVVDANLDLLEEGGVSAITAIGKYVFMAGYLTPSEATSVDAWADEDNQKETAVWVRGGAYARKYTVTAVREDDTSFEFDYTTPTSSYPGTLDTSTVPVYAADPAGGTTTDTESAYIISHAGLTQALLSWFAWAPSTLSVKKGATTLTNTYPVAPATDLQYSWTTGQDYVTFHIDNLGELDVTMTYTHTKTITNPNYSKTVSDLSNAYNTAVTQWIGTAAAAIAPAAIAEQLRLAAVAAGLTGGTVLNSTLYFSNVKAVSVSDSGDGTLIRGVANDVEGIDDITSIHKIGKIVKVKAKGSAEAFYLVAESKNVAVTSGYAEVTWVEGAGVVHTIDQSLIYMTAEGGEAHIASSADLLDLLTTGPAPQYEVSTVGDNDTSPLPFFIGKQITYLGVFQDRLIVGAGAVVRCSKTGDYLNFFRSSVLTVPADDPLEMLSQGSEDDTLRFSVMYDRDLVLFADKRQYAISGRVPLTPTSANMSVMSQHAHAADVPPVTAGSVIFYGQLGENSSSVHQIQPGVVAEQPDSFVQSSQIDTYIGGDIIELANHAKPTHLFARATDERSSLYCYTYLDKSSAGRVQDAWHRFDYDEALGPIVGMARTADGLLVFTIRPLTDASDVAQLYLTADLQSMTTGLATYPYLDSIRPLAQVQEGSGSVHLATVGPWSTVFDATSEWQFIGADLSESEALVEAFPEATGPMVGATQVCYFTPTNPYIRDKNDKAVTSGQLTITTVTVTAAQSSGLSTMIEARGEIAEQEYNGRIVGDDNDLIGREPVLDLTLALPIALGHTEYVLTLFGRSWLPFTITSIEWTGQWFNRTQRF